MWSFFPQKLKQFSIIAISLRTEISPLLSPQPYLEAFVFKDIANLWVLFAGIYSDERHLNTVSIR